MLRKEKSVKMKRGKGLILRAKKPIMKSMLNISCALFRFMEHKDHFKISDFIDSLRVSELKEYSTENALPNVMLSLFAMQELNIEEWKNGERFTVIPNGEFELAWCLEEIPEEYLQIINTYFDAMKQGGNNG